MVQYLSVTSVVDQYLTNGNRVSKGSAAPEDSPRRPVILGGGRRPGNLNSASAPRLGEDGPQPTQAEEQIIPRFSEPDERSLNQVLEPFLDRGRIKTNLLFRDVLGSCAVAVRDGSGPADEQQQVRTLQRFLKASPDPLNTWAGSGGPVSAVARAGRPDLARLLLRAKANVNDSDAKGVTALHIAAFDGMRPETAPDASRMRRFARYFYLRGQMLMLPTDTAKHLSFSRKAHRFVALSCPLSLPLTGPQLCDSPSVPWVHQALPRCAMAPPPPTFPARTLQRMQRQDECAMRCVSSFPDLTWTKKKSAKPLQDAHRRFPGPKHLQDYCGHVPRKSLVSSFNPFHGGHILEKSASLPAIATKSTQKSSAASTSFGMWYGHVGSFPSPVDNWVPAHFVEGQHY
eukprot:s1604_g5.t1